MNEFTAAVAIAQLEQLEEKVIKLEKKVLLLENEVKHLKENK